MAASLISFLSIFYSINLNHVSCQNEQNTKRADTKPIAIAFVGIGCLKSEVRPVTVWKWPAAFREGRTSGPCPSLFSAAVGDAWKNAPEISQGSHKGHYVRLF